MLINRRARRLPPFHQVIKNARTPALILIGDGDVPAPQSCEFWHALKTPGVEMQFVVYKREGQLFAKPEHQRDVITRTMAWFDPT